MTDAQRKTINKIAAICENQLANLGIDAIVASAHPVDLTQIEWRLLHCAQDLLWVHNVWLAEGDA
jgi:hypothetical protein